MKHARVPVTVSLPSNLAENFEKLAKAESKNKKPTVQGDAHDL